MRLSRVLALLALALVVWTQPAAAQQGAGDAGHRAAVKRLMEVTRIREVTEQSTEAMLTSQMQQMPQLTPYAGILRDFYREQMNWASLEPEFTRLYMEVFTEAELRELIGFYESPLGQKMLAKMPVLLAKSSELTTRRLQVAMPQLMQRLQAAVQGAGDGARSDSARAPKP